MAKENVQRFNSGTVQIFLCLSLFIPITDSADRRACMQGVQSGATSAPFEALGLWTMVSKWDFLLRNARETTAEPQNKQNESIYRKAQVVSYKITL